MVCDAFWGGSESHLVGFLNETEACPLFAPSPHVETCIEISYDNNCFCGHANGYDNSNGDDDKRSDSNKSSY